MPDTSLPENASAPQTEHKKKSDYFELKVPRPFLKNIPFIPILVIALVAFSYLLGLQTARIGFMEKDLARIQAVAGTTAGIQDPNEPVLGAKVDIDPGTLPVLGNKDAKVTMIEFSDFQCPFCKRFYDETFAQLKKDYIDTGKVKFAFRHQPLEIHPNAPKAGEAAECANDQDKFWEYHDILFEQFDSWINEPPETLTVKLAGFATQLGLDENAFTLCVDSGKYTEKVAADTQAGIAAGADATPTFFINGQPLVGAMPYQTFKTILDQELAKLE